MLFIEALGHTSMDTMETWQSNAIWEIMNQSFKKRYRKISSHRFENYGVQRAWVQTCTSQNDGFAPITAEQEKDIPFL